MSEVVMVHVTAGGTQLPNHHEHGNRQIAFVAAEVQLLAVQPPTDSTGITNAGVAACLAGPAFANGTWRTHKPQQGLQRCCCAAQTSSS
jgi:hypothetical protein